MRARTHRAAVIALWAAQWISSASALDAQVPQPVAPGLAPAAGINSAAAAPVSAPIAAGPAAEPSLAAPVAPAVVTPEAGVSTDDGGTAAMSEDAVAGIPLEDGGELVLGPEEKVRSDDHKAAAERFAHMRKDGKLSASSDLDREVPRILKREQAGDVHGALQAARAALARLPNHQNLRQITARLQVANGDYGSALLTLAPLLEIDRDNWLPFYWAGVAELLQGNLDYARAYLARACQLDADKPEPWIARAVVEQEAGNYGGSLQLYLVARQRSPARAEILSGMAYSQAMLEQGKGARVPPNVSNSPEAIVSQPAAATPEVRTATGARPTMAPQSFSNSPALSTGMGFAARAIAP